ncbi:MAG: hypothetical protein Q9207_003691 [Kuettlingeria erythrocarpa]
MPRSLTTEQKQQAHRQLEIQSLERQVDALTQELVAQFGGISKGASTPKYKEREAIRRLLKRCKDRAEKELFRRLLREFHATADLNYMVAQLKGTESFAELLPPVHFAHEERQRLATTLFQEVTETSFAQVVEDLSTLCTRCERSSPGGKSQSQDPVAESSGLDLTMDDSPEAPASAMDTVVDDYNCPPTSDKVPELQERYDILVDLTTDGSAPPATPKIRNAKRGRRICLFCTDHRKRGPTSEFARAHTLRRHYENSHFQYQVGPFVCPVPNCNKMIADRKVFANHAVAIHKNDIGVRATLKASIDRQKKPGTLPTFTI